MILADFTAVLSCLENSTSQVVCLGDSVSFECCVMNGISTVWEGSVFTHGLSCDSGEQMISLRHTRFNDSDYRISYNCLNGDVLAKRLSNEDDCYCSQLNFTVDSISSSQTVVNIQCKYDIGSITFTIANYSAKILDNDATMCRGSTSQKDIHQSSSNEKGRLQHTKHY